MKEAQFYKLLGERKVQCQLCPRKCAIADGQRGFCRVRENKGGKLYSLVYGKPCAINIDPIEKKPLFHFAPGTRCLSIATVGCNLSCLFCQNSEISHPESIEGEDAEPEAIVEMAKANNLPGIAYTYTEPTVFFEYALDIMKLARKAGLYNVWVSNGYTSPEPARKAARYMDAINVDLKGDIAFYKSLCAVPDEKPMHTALKIYKKAGVWIETTTLLIPGKNDRPEVVDGIVKWVKRNLGANTPIHFSRFFPHFRLSDVSPTPLETLQMAAWMAKERGMKYVYIGNVYGEGESTLCPRCGSVVIERRGYNIAFKSTCVKCRTKIVLAGGKWLR